MADISTSRVAVVTGGGQGIGKCTARALLLNNYRVVIADADKEAGHETEEEFKSLGEILFVPTDVSEEAQVKNLFNQARKYFKEIGLLVNDAGIATGFSSPLDKTSLRDWQNVIDVNLTGYFLCAKYASPLLKAAHGSIVNIASTRALMSEKDTFAYSASKGGIVALTHSLAMSLGPEIRVNCISPGWIDVSMWQKKKERRPAKLRDIDHEQHPAGRVGKPEDIAEMIVYLAGGHAGFITGANFVIDGGMTRKMIYAE